jgi:hypothetical protein
MKTSANFCPRMGGSRGQLVRRLRLAVRRLAVARWNAQASGLLSDELASVALDAVREWAQGSSEGQWTTLQRISRRDLDLLKFVGAWPWGNDFQLDAALEEAHLESVGVAAQV